MILLKPVYQRINILLLSNTHNKNNKLYISYSNQGFNRFFKINDVQNQLPIILGTTLIYIKRLKFKYFIPTTNTNL